MADVFRLSTMETSGVRPHILLAVYSDDFDYRSYSQELQAFSKSSASFKFQLGIGGTFPTAEGVVFLAPVGDERVAHLSPAFSHSLF